MISFAIFLTTFVKEYESIVINFLINKGYTVSAFSKDGKVTSNSESPFPIYVISLKAETTKESLETSEFYNLIKDLFFSQKRSFYTLIVHDLSGTRNSKFSWGVGKIFVPEVEQNNSTGSPFRDVPKLLT